LLANGQSYDQIRERLTLLSAQELLPVPVTEDVRMGAPLQMVGFLSDAMHSVADGQQLLLNSQQANRNLLQVAVQDNFNLKEENARLRERMMRLEQELSENRRREEARREMLERRLERLEDIAYRIDAPSEEESTEPAEKPRRRGWLARLFGA
jgi:response regulator RpfG family c-di-GMP phosphodiesterase